MKTKITLSGEVASGKSTVGKLLAEQLGYQFISLGNLIRKRAENEGVSIVEFQRRCTENPEIDKEIDLEFACECNKNEHLIIDYRLGFKFISNAFHVFLKISEEDASERLRKYERADESSKTISERNNAFKKQFKNAYDINYTLESHYDLVVTINNKITPQEIVDIILSEIRS
ncbi:MAG: AAA family ATPase [Chlorobi bacterium]|uniref:Cytidylate kinase family protein n=1 Tax=Chryseobacterium gambrini TaxID=373672 RepID=A0AAJ1R498_9FLAO|nr:MULTISPECIES: cytidylate kinase family protein [Chryseobacterium]MDN4013408.1 cytidylate kinase family protein [Chryseobacterium gambrini]MDN4031618.1 cytidylate kinase family protein [Chryseobacterium gambrini]NPA10538.1 AAA family ATPase [Chlorobiota bacterium]QWA39459.1 cytidylate kinase family protein [Chryseobacterium sp. ZHDP1]